MPGYGADNDLNGGTLRVLVVEDEVLIADLLAMIVEDAGHAVVGMVPSGEQALEFLRGQEADVALVDVKLKGRMDGIELARALRDDHRVPFVFVTGSGDPTTRSRAAALEPLAFVLKPFKPAAIADALARLRPHG